MMFHWLPFRGKCVWFKVRPAVRTGGQWGPNVSGRPGQKQSTRRSLRTHPAWSHPPIRMILGSPALPGPLKMILGSPALLRPIRMTPASSAAPGPIRVTPASSALPVCCPLLSPHCWCYCYICFILYIFLNKSEDLIFPAPLCKQSLLAATCSAEMLLHPGSSTWCVCTADYWLRPMLFNPPWGLTWVSHVAWGQTRVHCVSCSAFGALKHWTKTTTLLPLQVLAVSLLWKHGSKSRFRPSLPVSLTPDEWTQSEETHRSSSRMIQWCHHVHTAPGGKTGFLQLVSWYIIPGVVHLHGNMKFAEC